MKYTLGIELGSTRIKAVMIDENYTPAASGAHDWENRLENGIWTYHLDDVWIGIQDAFRSLTEDAREKGVSVTDIRAMGISAMMHGYLALDKEGRQLAPFRTWRNTTTEQAAKLLTEEFGFNIPQRWSIAHLYQAILNKEDHVKDIAFLTTLAGYVHWKLTGRKVIGVGEASGMFPIGAGTRGYDARMMSRFQELIADCKFDWTLESILPDVLNAGDIAGILTKDGAKLLDPAGGLQEGIAFCAPEGDAGTGMVATNSVAERTGNVSAGTSVFAMIVLEKELSKIYPEIDMVTTPAGKPVAMVHCNNCTSDIDAWVKLFEEVTETFGQGASKSALYEALYSKALEGETDGGGLLSYNYYSGEPITALDEGRPMLVRMPNSRFTLANLMRTLLFSSMGTLKLGMDILTKEEGVKLDQLLGHGGLFKTKEVGQKLMAAALNVPVTVMESAGEGGPWGMAVLAAYAQRENKEETLEEYLSGRVFEKNKGSRIEPEKKDAEGFAAFMEMYTRGLAIERAAVEHMSGD